MTRTVLHGMVPRRPRRGAHQFLAWHARFAAQARRNAARSGPAAGRYVGVLADLAGPKIRIESFYAKAR